MNKYDHELFKIKHYSVHPEMKPFIGKHYDKFKLLLVGESHYIGEVIDLSQEEINEWYDNEALKLPKFKEYYKKGWINTRDVLNNYLDLKRSKAHSMFKNPSDVLVEVINTGLSGKYYINDCDAINCMAFMNYFQRPATKKGKSIESSGLDCKVSAETFNEVVKVLEPNKIIFASKKAYNAYTNSSQGDKTLLDKAVCLAHPTTKYWWGEDGRAKMLAEITEYIDVNRKGFLAYLEGEHKKRINLMKDVFKNVSEKLSALELKVDSTEIDRLCEAYYSRESECLPRIESKIEIGGSVKYLYVEVWDNLWCYISDKRLQPDEKAKRIKTWTYLPEENGRLNFRGYTERMADIIEDEDIRKNVMNKIVQSLCEFIDKNQ